LVIEDEPIGIAVLEEKPAHLLIYSIAGRSDVQGKGYGKALLNFLRLAPVPLRAFHTARLSTSTEPEQKH
jgi:hypothetical protein